MEPQAQRVSPLLRLSDDVLLLIYDAVTAAATPEQNHKAVKRNLPSLKALSQCNRRLRAVLTPEISYSLCLVRPHGWKQALERISFMARSEDVQQYTQCLYLNLFCSSLKEPVAEEDVWFRDRFTHYLVNLLHSLTRLKDVVLVFHPGGDNEAITGAEFCGALEAEGAVFPSVERLDITPQWHTLLYRFPSLRSVVTYSQSLHKRDIPKREELLIKTCGSLLSTRLQHFEMASDWDGRET